MHLFLLFLLYILVDPPVIRCEDGDDEEPMLEDLKWKLDMVHKVHLNHSKNYIGVERLMFVEKGWELPLDPNMYQSDHERRQFELRKLFAMNRPNMGIHFDEDATGAASCEIDVYDEKNFRSENAFLEASEFQQCSIMVNQVKRLMPYCNVPHADDEKDLFSKQKADGIYNRPSKAPQCLYDFYQAATNSKEYDLFKYCAKGYFFQGKDHTEENKFEFTKDFLLYLTEGQLICNISESVEDGREMMAKGYKVRLVQRNYRKADKRLCALCPTMKAVASSYEDFRSDGKFFLGAVFGGIQLEGEIDLWNETNAKNRLFYNQEIEAPIRACYYIYEDCLLTPDGRFVIQLEIEHHCSARGMRQTAVFDVSVGAKQTTDGVYEDSYVKIFLSPPALILRSTGQQLPSLSANEIEVKDKTQSQNN